MIFLERFHVISHLPCVCFAGKPETFAVAGYALVDKRSTEWQVLQMLNGIAICVGYPAGTAEVVAVIYEAAGDSRNAAVCRRMHPAAPLRNQFRYVIVLHYYWFSNCKDTYFSRIDKILSFSGVRSAVQHLAAVLGSAEAAGADMSVVALQQVGISQMA